MGETEGTSPKKDENEQLSSFVGPLQALDNVIGSYHDRGIIIGGLAVSLLGIPRFTADADALLLIDDEDIGSLLDLIIMKAIAHRPQDIQDIRGVFERNSDLDKVRIREWVNAFSELMEAPKILQSVAEWLK